MNFSVQTRCTTGSLQQIGAAGVRASGSRLGRNVSAQIVHRFRLSLGTAGDDFPRFRANLADSFGFHGHVELSFRVILELTALDVRRAILVLHADNARFDRGFGLGHGFLCGGD